MIKINFQYLIAALVMLAVEGYVLYNVDKYGIVLSIIGFIILAISISLIPSKTNYTHAVVDKDRQVLCLFEDEESAINFADNQEVDSKVVMLHIK